MDNLNLAIKEYVNEGSSNLTNLAKKYKTSFKRLKNELLKLNLLKPKAANYQIFDNLDNEEIYLLGLIFADGCISSKNYKNDKYDHNIFELGLMKSDEDHIKNFAKFINYTNKIYYTKEMYRICISNEYLWEKLNSLGCVPKKSTILKFPEYLTKEQIPHFIRGYCDGDGCLTWCDKDHKIPKISFIGCYEFINQLNKNLPLLKNNSIIKENENVYVVNYTGKNAYLIAKWLYETNNSKLQRKFERYKEFRRLYEES